MKIRSLRFGAPVVGGLAALFVAVPALAYVCHPDSPGTRTLALHGTVSGYALDGNTVRVRFRAGAGCARLAVWRPFAGPAVRTAESVVGRCLPRRATDLGSSVVVGRHPAAALDGFSRAVARGGAIEVFRGGVLVRRIQRTGGVVAKLALKGGWLAVLVRPGPGADRPDRLETYDLRTGRQLHDWPLLARPATLDLQGGIAIFSAAGKGGLYALRLSDGRTTFISPVRPRDTPQIGPRGLVYQSNLLRSVSRQGRVLIKFLPTSVVASDLAATVDSLRTRRPIAAFSMDGPRVAVVLRAPARACDQVRYWNIPWHYFARINMASDLTCAHRMSIRSLSIGGITAEWVAVKNHVARVVISNSVACIERVVALGTSAKGILLAGDGHLLGLAGSRGSQLKGPAGFVDPLSGQNVVSAGTPALALSAGGDRLAILRANGRVDLVGSDGIRIRTLRLTSPRAIALRRDQLVALTRTGRLEVWSTAPARREHAWRVPAGTMSAVDLHFGIAVFTSGRTVYAMNIATGRTAVLARAPQAVRAQIEAPGVVYTYNAHGRGFLRFVPLSSVERSLRMR